MKFALIDNIKTEASITGGRGKCQHCGGLLIAHCGPIRRNHWKHHPDHICSSNKESETDWHRVWKEYFPNDWQEVRDPDIKTGELHIADVKTDHGLVIEFQHSRIEPEERVSREKYYQRMVWVVDRSHLKRDYPKLLKGIDELKKTNQTGFYIANNPEHIFHKAWVDSKVPVLFDFLGLEKEEIKDPLKATLFCLLPRNQSGASIVIAMPRQTFINGTIEGHLFREVNHQQVVEKLPLQSSTSRIDRNRYYDKKTGLYFRKGDRKPRSGF